MNCPHRRDEHVVGPTSCEVSPNRVPPQSAVQHLKVFDRTDDLPDALLSGQETSRLRQRVRRAPDAVPRFPGLVEAMARVTGLEPATSGVTGRRSNQLSYTRIWRERRCKGPARARQPAPEQVSAERRTCVAPGGMGGDGFEPPTLSV